MLKKIDWPTKIVELIVVIAGVTIAFSLNNWNENRKAKKLEAKFYASFVSELEEDMDLLQNYLDTIPHYLDLNSKLLSVISDRDYENDSLFTFVYNSYAYFEFRPRSTTYDALKASGNLGLIGDFSLMKEITELYSYHYQNVQIIDEAHNDLQFKNVNPYLQKNLRLRDNNQILNPEIITETYFINLVYNRQYLLTSKQEIYQFTLDQVKQVKSRIENELNKL
jgi:hypothetical protein